MSRFFSSQLSRLTPYTPGEQPKDLKYIKLNTNESPFPPSEKAIRLASEAAEKLNLYPDPTCFELIKSLAEAYSVNENQIIVGNGSDEILFFAFSAFCDSSVGAVFPNITYGFYEVFAGLCKTKYTKIPLESDFTIDVNDYKGVGKTVFIANPNAPTGIALSLEEIESIVKSNPDNVVVIDEAYVDFGTRSAVSLINKYPNLLVVQTFSKSRSMAGARLGMGFASPELIRDLNTVKYSLNPYNVNKMTLAAGIGTLADREYTRACCDKIIETREYSKKMLDKLGFEFPDSKANFIFAKSKKKNGKEIYLELKKRGILVRHFDTELLCDYNRITIGTKEQMDCLFEALTNILEDA